MDSKPYPASLYGYSPLSPKRSPRRGSDDEDYREGYIDKYSQMLPMQGLTSNRSRRPNPLQIYYKNLDIVRPRKIETERFRKVTLPQIRRSDFDTKPDQDESINQFSSRPQHSSAMVDADTPLYGTTKDALNQTTRDHHQYKEPQNNLLTKKAKPFAKVIKKDPVEVKDYADFLMKREYGNYDKRTKKVLGHRLQNYNNNRAKSWAKYLGSNIKPQLDEIFIQSKFMTPRNEYPILN